MTPTQWLYLLLVLVAIAVYVLWPSAEAAQTPIRYVPNTSDKEAALFLKRIAEADARREMSVAHRAAKGATSDFTRNR